MTRVHGLQVINYEFSGFVYVNDLSKGQLDALRIDENDEIETLEVSGEFEVGWDEEIPMPKINSITLFGLENKYIQLDEDDVNFSELEQEILETDNGDWAIDLQAAEGDRAYDSYIDNFILADEFDDENT